MKNRITSFFPSLPLASLFLTSLTLLVVLSAQAQVPSNVPTNGLISYWPFNGNANDASGNGNNGTVAGATLTTDRFNVANNAYLFSGTNVINVPHNASLNSYPLTVSAWIKTDATFTTGNGGIIKKYVSASWNGWFLELQINSASNSTVIPGYLRSASPCTGVIEGYSICSNPVGMNYSGAVNNTNWHHLVFRVDANSGVLYLDGILVSQQAWIGTAGGYTTTTPLTIGTNFKGKIDDIGIWNRSLSSSEIINLYNSTPLPTATITPATASTFCQGGSVVLNANTGTGLSYQWFKNAVAINGATSSSYTASTSGSYTVVVTNTSGFSATSTATIVTVNASPTATITPATATAFCAGGSVVLNANTGAGLSYQWKLNGTNISGATSSTYTANASGSYTVTVTNASACSATSTATIVTVNPSPTATITPATATAFCAGGSVILNANTGAGLSYQWKLNGTNITGATTSSYTANASGSYTVTVLNSSSCTATSSATVVTVNELPPITVSPANGTTICNGQSITLTANDNTTATPIQTQVNNLVNSGLWSLVATYNGRYYLKYQTSMTWPLAKTLCEQSGGYMFCVNSQLENDNVAVPIANSVAYGDFLIGLFQDLTDINYSEPSGGWKWVDGSPLTYTHWASLATGWVIDEPSGTPGENYGIMDYNNIGSFWIDTWNNTNGTVIMEFPGNTSYLWSTGATTQTINVAPTSTTTYTCAVTTNGVTCTQSVTITVDPLTATITPASSTTICQGESVVLNGNTGAGLTYQWRLNGYNISGATSAEYIATASGNYTVQVSNSSGCSDISSTTFVVVNSAIISQPTDEFAAIGGNAQFNFTAPDSTTFQWQSYYNGQWVNLYNAGQYSGVNTSDLIVNNVYANNYDQWFRCLVTSSQSLFCQEYTDSVTIYGCSVFQENFQIATSQDSICFGNGFSAELIGLNDSSSFYNNNLLYLPDDQTQCFSSSILISGFSNSETIQSVSDIESLAINFEHSYMGDLVISYICPNGQSIIVHQQGGFGTSLGEPIDTSIVAINSPAGNGYDYSWSPAATAGTWQAYILSNPNDTILPSGTYNSVEPFSNLIGCPVNGLWTIEFCDLLAIDDGWLFNWGVNFNSVVSTASYDSVIWQGNDLVWDDGNGNALFYPNQFGSNEYSVSATLTNGCILSDTLSIEAIGPNISLIPEIYTCSLPLTLDATIQGSADDILWTYSNEPTALSATNILNPTILTQPTSNVYDLYVTTNTNGLFCTDTAQVVVNIIDPTILQQPNSMEVNIGDTAHFYCLSSIGMTYQWQIYSNGIWTDLIESGQFSGVTTSQLSVSNVDMSNVNQQFQCVVSSPDGACIEYSNAVTFYICDIATSSIPAVLNIALNSSPIITILPANSNATYQWQTNIGFGWENINDGSEYSGTSTAELTLINSDWLNDNQWLQCIVSSETCSDTTNICVVNITPTGINETELSSIYYYENAIRFSNSSVANGEQYYVFDGNGKIIKTGIYLGENSIELNLQASGMYCFKLEDNIIKFIKM